MHYHPILPQHGLCSRFSTLLQTVLLPAFRDSLRARKFGIWIVVSLPAGYAQPIVLLTRYMRRSCGSCNVSVSQYQNVHLGPQETIQGLLRPDYHGFVFVE
jgi:hypothetical protein